MRRFLLIALLVLAVLLLAVTGICVWLLNDEAFLKKQVGKYTHEYTGRELVIAGPLELDLGRETTIEVSGIGLANAPWADSPQMLEIGHVKVTVELPSLFKDLVYLPYLHLENCSIEILENEAGASNWDFPGETDVPEEEEPGLLAIALKDLLVKNCSLVYNEPGMDSPLDVRIATATLERALHDRVVGEVSGSVNGEMLDIEGWLAPASAFVNGGEIRHELKFRAGAVTLDSSGSIADIDTFSGPDISGHFQGPDIGKILRDYGLPPLSDGAFEFRADVATRDGLVHVNVDGDLGSLELTVDGAVDNLRAPSEGHFQASAAGPNLQALGQALGETLGQARGIDKLVPDPFRYDTRIHFESDTVLVDHARIETHSDSLQLSGTISTKENFAGSELALAFESAEIGRWAPLLDWPEEELGAISMEGRLVVDTVGAASVDAHVAYQQSELTANGLLGAASGPFEPDLDFDFRSSNMPRLAALVGYEGFPARPFALKGHVRKTGQELHFSELALSLNRSTATASGAINLVKDFSGSEIDADISIPDVADFGLLFGVDDLMHEPLHVKGVATLDNGGLAFRVSDSSLGEIRLKVDGKIADLQKPSGIDADFDIYLPGLRFLRIWKPDLALPAGSLEARGHLHNRNERTGFDQVRLSFAGIEGVIDGEFGHDGQFDLSVEAGGPDLTLFKEILDVDFHPVPFSLSTRLAGTPEAFTLAGLDLTAGKSRLTGTLDLELGEVKRISGELVSPYLNLNPWSGEEAQVEAPAQPEKPPRYVFDDTPIASITDIGIELDLHLVADELEVNRARYDQFEIGILLLKDHLEVRPFSISGDRSGTISGDLVLDSSSLLPQLDADLQVSDMKLELGAQEGQDPATLPTGSADLVLHGKGRTRREMAAGLDGTVRLHVGPGQLAPSGYGFLMGDFTTELLSTLNPFAEKNEFTELECVVGAADIVSGQVVLKPLVLVTRQVTVISQGKVTLDTEHLDISFNTKQRKGLGISATDLVNPFVKVGGTLASPSLELDPAGTVIKGGIAVATAGLSILAGSLADRYLSSKDPCGKALKEIRERDGEG